MRSGDKIKVGDLVRCINPLYDNRDDYHFIEGDTALVVQADRYTITLISNWGVLVHGLGKADFKRVISLDK